MRSGLRSQASSSALRPPGPNQVSGSGRLKSGRGLGPGCWELLLC